MAIDATRGKMFGLIGAIVIALIFVWLLPVLLVAIFTVPMAIAAHVRERFKISHAKRYGTSFCN